MDFLFFKVYRKYSAFFLLPKGNTRGTHHTKYDNAIGKHLKPSIHALYRGIGFLTSEQASALLNEARKIDFYIYAFIFFALKTGRRLGEILKVEWSDIDFEKEEIRFHISKKMGGWMIVRRKPPESVFRMLLLLKRTNEDKPFSYFPRREWRRVRDKVDGELKLPDRRFHALRHRCATEMIEKGATLYDVQHYFCHSNPSTTMIYAHISEKRDEKIRSFLE